VTAVDRSALASDARPASRPNRSLGIYLAILAVDLWLVFVLTELQMDRSVGEAIASSARLMSPMAIVLLALVAIGFVPALVLSMELVARRPPPSPLGRALAGAIAWGAWSAIVLLGPTSLSGLVLFEMSVFAGFALFAFSGALHALLALDSETPPPSRTLIGLALITATLVIVGSLLTRGMWGGPA
jgi:hypothetical protein